MSTLTDNNVLTLQFNYILTLMYANVVCQLRTNKLSSTLFTFK